MPALGIGTGIGFASMIGNDTPPAPTGETLFDHATETGGAGNADVGTTVAVELYAIVAGEITQVWFWKPANDTANARSVGVFVHGNATPLATGSSTGESAGPAWVAVDLDEPYAINNNVLHIAAVQFPNGFYPASANYFLTEAKARGNLVAPEVSDSSAGNGRFANGAGLTYPNSTFNGGNYWIDITFVED